MDPRSLVHPSRNVYVDEHLCQEIAELTDISYRVLYSAFAGEEKNLVLGVVRTAIAENLKGTPEDWQRHVLTWVKENASGE